MSELTSPKLPPGTVISYGGEIKGPFAPGTIDHFTYRGALISVHHGLLLPTEEATLILRGMGQDFEETGALLGRPEGTVTTQCRTAFRCLGKAGMMTRAVSRLFMPEYGPILKVEHPIELPQEPDEDLTRVLTFLSTHTKYAQAKDYPGLNPSKVKEDVARYVSALELRNRDELMLWGNATRILGPGEVVINPTLMPPLGPPPLQEPAKGIPADDFSVYGAKSGPLRFPEEAILPPDAALHFTNGRLAVIRAWGGAVAVNRRSELYRDVSEAGVNHLGAMALGLSVKHSGFLTPYPDYTRRALRQDLGLAAGQPIHHGLHRAFEEELLIVTRPIPPGRIIMRRQLSGLLNDLVSGQSHQQIVANHPDLTERMLSYEILLAREQFDVEEFNGVVAYSHMAGWLHAASSGAAG